MTGRLAILSGAGALPLLLARAVPDVCVIGFDNLPNDFPAGQAATFAIEQLGGLIAHLRAEGVDRLVMAGAITSPVLDPARFDALMQAEAPGLMAAMADGDDAALRHLVGIFRAQGFEVLGAHDLLPSLTLTAQHIGPDADAQTEADIAKAQSILLALAPLDIGQGAVVAGGLCLGIETVQGTDALLAFVAATPPARRPASPGAFVKLPKTGQDLRVDMPAIGPQTIKAAREAGLAGLVIAAGATLLLDRDAVLRDLQASGLFLRVIEVSA